MFRRRRDAPAGVRFPRGRKRPAAPAAESDFEFSSRVEKGVVGVLDFFGSAFGILWRFVVSPRTFDRAADDAGQLARSVPPYTFLTLAAFIATTAFRALLTGGMMAWLAFQRGCAPETQDAFDRPGIGEYLKVPSVEDVIATGIPSVLMILLVLALLVRLLARRTPGETGRFRNLCIYIVGFQYLLAFVMVLALLPAVYSLGIHMDNVPYGDVASLLLLFAVIAWPAALFASQLLKAIPPGSRPLHRIPGAGIAVIGLGALLASVSTLIPGLVVAYPLAIRALEIQAKPRPLIEVALLDGDTASVPPVPLALMLTNRSQRLLHLLPSSVQYQDRGTQSGSKPVLPARVTAWQGGDVRLLTLKPGDSAWLMLDVDTRPGGVGAPCDKRIFGPWNQEGWMTAPAKSTASGLASWLLVDFAYPTPEATRGRVCFVNIESSGEATPVYAFVQGPSS
jgi:hypothetical protein